MFDRKVSTLPHKASGPARWLKLCLSTLLCLLLTSCDSPSEPPLRIAMSPWPGFQPFFLAQDLGYYSDIPVELYLANSGVELRHALRTGLLEGAAFTLDETLSLIDEGFELKVILITDFSSGADVLLAKPHIESLAELHGKRVAVDYQGVGAILLHSALAAAKLEARDIRIVHCTIDKHVSCYPQADAIITFEPYRSLLLEQGARQLYDSSQIEGLIVDVVAVTLATLESRPQALEQLLAGYFKARAFLRSQPTEAAELMSPHLGLSPAQVPLAFEGLRLPELAEIRQLLSGQPSDLSATAQILADFMHENKLTKHELEVQDIADARFLPKQASP